MLLKDLFEMAKSATKRKRAAKQARKDKAENPSVEKSNPVAKFAQSSGAGAHQEKGKLSRGKRQRQEGKRQSQEY